MTERAEPTRKPTTRSPRSEGAPSYAKVQPTWALRMPEAFAVITPEGYVEAKAGDFLCEGPEGDRWPVAASIFLARYEERPAQLHRVIATHARPAQGTHGGFTLEERVIEPGPRFLALSRTRDQGNGPRPWPSKGTLTLPRDPGSLKALAWLLLSLARGIEREARRAAQEPAQDTRTGRAAKEGGEVEQDRSGRPAWASREAPPSSPAPPTPTPAPGVVAAPKKRHEHVWLGGKVPGARCAGCPATVPALGREASP